MSARHYPRKIPHKRPKRHKPTVPFSCLKIALGMNTCSHKEINAAWREILIFAGVLGDAESFNYFIPILQTVVNRINMTGNIQTTSQLVMLCMNEIFPRNYEFI